MQQFIEEYRAGLVGLGLLVDHLESLNAALEGPTTQWLENFEPAWGTLEEVYAGMRSEGQIEMNENEQQVVEQALAQLEFLIRSRLDDTETNTN